MHQLTEQQLHDVKRIFHHLFQLSQQKWPSLETDCVLCIELPITFRGYVLTASFTGGKDHIMLGIGRKFLDNDKLSYSSYAHARLKKDSFYRHVNGTFLSPEEFDFELKYAPLHSKREPKSSQDFVHAFLNMHDSLRHGEFELQTESFTSFFGILHISPSPKLSL